MGLTLDVLIATIYPEGIERVAGMALPHLDGVRYVVAWQKPGSTSVPEELKREDVLICPHDSVGLSRNRNHALERSTADLCLIADDDLDYSPEMLQTVIDTFENHRDIDIATFKMECPDSKRYSDEEFDLGKPPRGFYLSEVEMAFRRESVAGRVSFCPLLGLGSGCVLAGEGEVFLIQALRNGLKGRYFPKVITRHPTLSTGNRKNQPGGVVMAAGVIIYMRHPHTWFPRIIKNALSKHRHGLCRADKAFFYLWRGVAFARRNFNLDGSER